MTILTAVRLAVMHFVLVELFHCYSCIISGVTRVRVTRAATEGIIPIFSLKN